MIYQFLWLVRLMRFSLRQLEIFLAIARHRTTGAAAAELCLSQSAVSSALQTLESAYDLQLFDRVGKRLELNAVGQSLRTSAEALLSHARTFESEMLSHDQIGHLKIAASFTIANHLAVDYLAVYLEQHPNAKVEISSGNSPDVVARVRNFEVDLGMIENEINHPELELTPWINDELVVFCSREHPLANKRDISERDLLDARWILREPDSGARQRFDHTFSGLLPQIKIYMQFKHNEPIKRAVERGLGISCLSDRVLQTQFADGSLVPLRLNKKYRMQRRFYLVTPRAGHRSPAVDAFMKVCMDL